MASTATTLGGRIIDEIGNVLLQPPLGGFGRVALHGDRGRRLAAITFDDGPNAPSTGEVLDVLGLHGVKATFFCVGINATRFPDLVRRAHAEGHVVGNHSMLHSRKAGLSWSDQYHIDECTAVLSELLGVTPRLYRPPWGWLTPWETRRLLRRRFNLIGWDVYTYDWQTPPPDGHEIAVGVRRDARPGSIILFHDGIAGVHEAEKPETVRAVDRTIKLLQADGYQFVTIPELLGVEPYAIAEPATVGDKSATVPSTSSPRVE